MLKITGISVSNCQIRDTTSGFGYMGTCVTIYEADIYILAILLEWLGN
jgi:hypothetical protein